MQFNRGTSAMQHYVGLRPMFDVEVMNEDARVVLGDQGSLPSPSNVSRGLSALYKEITGVEKLNLAMRFFPPFFLLLFKYSYINIPSWCVTIVFLQIRSVRKQPP